jgi:hypothetical protein
MRRGAGSPPALNSQLAHRSHVRRGPDGAPADRELRTCRRRCARAFRMAAARLRARGLVVHGPGLRVSGFWVWVSSGGAVFPRDGATQPATRPLDSAVWLPAGQERHCVGYGDHCGHHEPHWPDRRNGHRRNAEAVGEERPAPPAGRYAEGHAGQQDDPGQAADLPGGDVARCPRQDSNLRSRLRRR